MLESCYLPNKAIDYLKNELEARKTRRPNYSLRAFARDLELSPSTVSELFKDKVGLSKARAQQVAKKMRLSQLHAQHFCDLMVSCHARSTHEKKEALIRARARIRSVNHQVSVDQFKFISDWQHFAILELIDLDPRYHSIKALAHSLGLTQAVITESIARLVRLELLIKASSFYQTSSGKTTVGEDIPSLAIQSYHQQILDKAKDALRDVAIGERDFQSTLLTCRQSDIPQMKKDLEKIHTELVEKYYHKDKKDRLYCLGMQLFPLAKENL